MQKWSTLMHIREYVEGTLFQVSKYDLDYDKYEGPSVVFLQ
jgi:hypothetical protein